MSYAALGAIPIPAPPIDKAAQDAKAVARSQWIAQGPGSATDNARLFDIADSLATGVAQSDSSGSGILNAARMSVGKFSSQEISDATGVPAEIVALGQQAIVSGQMPNFAAIGRGVGAAAGMAACAATGAGAAAAPLCGVIGSVVGAVVGTAVKAAQDGITHLLGGKTDEDRAAEEVQRQAGQQIHALIDGVTALEQQFTRAVRYNMAMLYNNALGLGIGIPAPVGSATDIDEMQRRLLNDPKYGGSPDVYDAVNGVGALAKKVAALQDQFVTTVQNTVNAKYNKLWDKDLIESQYVPNAESWMLYLPINQYIDAYMGHNAGLFYDSDGHWSPNLDTMDREIAHMFRMFPTTDAKSPTLSTIWPDTCSPEKVFGADYVRGRVSAWSIPGVVTQPRMQAACAGQLKYQDAHTSYIGGDAGMCSGPERVQAWLCHAQTHLKWFAAIVRYYGRKWAEIATRSTALVVYKRDLVALKAKQAAAAAAAAVRATAAKNVAQAAAASKALPTGAGLLLLQTQAMQSTKVKKAVAVGAVGVAAAVVLWVILD